MEVPTPHLERRAPEWFQPGQRLKREPHRDMLALWVSSLGAYGNPLSGVCFKVLMPENTNG